MKSKPLFIVRFVSLEDQTSQDIPASWLFQVGPADGGQCTYLKCQTGNVLNFIKKTARARQRLVVRVAGEREGAAGGWEVRLGLFRVTPSAVQLDTDFQFT